MKTILNIGLWLMIAVSLLSACNDDNTKDNENVADVYAAGYETVNNVHIATIWKNGVATHLTDGTEYYSQVNSVFVSSNDVYVLTSYSVRVNEDMTFQRLWKNGSVLYTYATHAAQSYFWPSDIFVSENDVYAAGREDYKDQSSGMWKERAALQKNGMTTYLDMSNANSGTSSIFVSNNDVYVTGSIGKNAVLWKNGITTTLTQAGAYESSKASNVIVKDNNVYLLVSTTKSNGTYSIYGTDKVYKNNTLLYSVEFNTSNAEIGNVSRLYVEDSDVYLAGYEYVDGVRTSFIYKNSDKIHLETNITVADIAVSDNDVYIVGSEDSVATLWKNGEPTYLSKSESVASSIFIHKH